MQHHLRLELLQVEIKGWVTVFELVVTSDTQIYALKHNPFKNQNKKIKLSAVGHETWLTQRVLILLFYFRLDLVPINRSVGLKAKPTKPVTEVLRPVVAKYGLHLSDLVARIVSLSSDCRQTCSVSDASFKTCMCVSVWCRVGSRSLQIQVCLFPTWTGCGWYQIQQKTLLEKVRNKHAHNNQCALLCCY